MGAVQPLKSQYVSAAEFDYIKLNFPDLGPSFTLPINQRVMGEFEKLQDKHSTQELKKPRFTFLAPAKNRPNGAYIVELFGFTSTLVYHFPSDWLKEVTYAHLKAYTDARTEMTTRTLGQALGSSIARRGVSITTRGANYRGVKGTGTTLRIGSRLSDFHYVWYKRPAQAAGVEVRFRGDRLEAAKQNTADLLSNFTTDDSNHWSALRVMLANRGYELLAGDLGRRGIKLSAYTSLFQNYEREAESGLQQVMELDEVAPFEENDEGDEESWVGYPEGQEPDEQDGPVIA